MKSITGIFTALAVACSPNGKGLGDANCTAEGLAGLGTATMDGDTWEADSGSWNTTGSGVQIVLQFDRPDRSMTVRGSRDEDGIDIADRIDAGEFPINVSLSGEDGTGNVRDGRMNSSYASTDASGNLSILSVEGNVMTACFSFVAVNDDSQMMEVTEGKAEVEEL